MDENIITERAIGAAIEVHRALGPGLLESTYQRCLAHELRLRGIAFEQQVALGLDYKGLLIETAYRADFVVLDAVILELKAVRGFEPVHAAQLLTYLRWSGLRLGLMINFNVCVLRNGIKRVVNGF